MSLKYPSTSLLIALSIFLGISNTGPSQAANSLPLNSPQKISQSQAKIKVFFPNPSKNTNNLGYVEPVFRTPTNKNVAEFAIQQLIIGPNASEKSKGLVAPIKLRGDSNCGQDFKISIVKDIAKIQFCRLIISGGIGDDARIKSSIQTTLKQFSTIKSVVILTNKGDCFGDMSGDNLCLKKPQ